MTEETSQISAAAITDAGSLQLTLIHQNRSIFVSEELLVDVGHIFLSK
jgi:hypothetical protein